MLPRKKSVARPVAGALTCAVVAVGGFSLPANAVQESESQSPGIQLEQLDRGLVAATTSEGNFLSWRLLATEVTGATKEGLTGANFAVYRNGEKIATVTDSTNYLDPRGGRKAHYSVAAVVDGHQLHRSESVTPWEQNYTEIPLQKPEPGVTPDGESYTYSANDMSIGDMDGDGDYEYVVKWEPSNSKDVSQVGYTGPTYVDTYTMEGELLYRIDLGVNIRSGAHYTQLNVYDFDGDGRSEIMVKTAPGTKTISYDDDGNVAGQQYITMPKKDVKAGYNHQDDYRMSAADYYDHVVDMFRGWHEHPQVKAGNWPATLEEAFGIEPRYEYPLSKADAQSLADYFMDVYAPSRSDRNKLRQFEGFVLTGPEYLTVFDGATGEELDTVRYEPGRTDDGLMWGDYAYPRIEPGNRVDRFLSGVAYLDGKHPTAIIARGYYTRAAIVAYNFNGENLSKEWTVDSGWTPMDNPFNATPHGTDGTDTKFGSITTQGFHSLTAADVDGDGKQEIVYGGATIDQDGSLLYSSFDELPPGSADPGARARLGHGDAMHVTDINPDRKGLEIFTVHEGASSAPYGYVMRDAATGEVVFGEYSGADTGRGMVGDVRKDIRGIESWAMGMQSATGADLGEQMPGTNMSIKWSADMTTQIITGSGDTPPSIENWQEGTVLTADGTRTNNGTKGNPALVADAFGDWREEMFVRTADSSAIRVYLSTEVTDHKLTTLMHDPQYRAEVARQNTAYNQPSYTSYYLASDMDFRDVPVPDLWTPGAVAGLNERLDQLVDAGDVTGPIAHQLDAAIGQAERAAGQSKWNQAVMFLERALTRLERLKKPDDVSDAAKRTLLHRTKTVLSMLR
ncbi:rhamnogalacturonan lyase [Arthrobacter castelli]|uniref:rhamnogalacturonan lyase n=1 Tax=Arthrobacter castelli TaxID=271431 RepID=UPI0003F97032|nr:rhamnogalacturonan lyase [Arthrobacter castelli]